MSANPGRATYHQTNIQAPRFTPSPLYTGESIFLIKMTLMLSRF